MRASWATSTREGMRCSDRALPCFSRWALEASSMAAAAPAVLVHAQQSLVCLPQEGLGEASQPREHLGFGHSVGFLQLQVHLGAEQVGLHLGTAGVQTVWHLAGKQTF